MGVEGGRPAVPDSDSGPQTRLSDRLEEETYNQNRIDPSGGGDAIGSPRSTAAAVRIQSVSRGKRARESVTQLRAERDRSFAGAADLSPGQGADKRANQTEEPSRGGDAIGSPRSTAAAVRIQSVSRGKRARGRVAELRAERDKSIAGAAAASPGQDAGGLASETPEPSRGGGAIATPRSTAAAVRIQSVS